MSGKGNGDALGAAIAQAMRSALREWSREHGNGADPEVLWSTDVVKLTIHATYTPSHHGFLAVEVVSKRPGRTDLYPFHLQRGSGRVLVSKRRGAT